MRRINFTLLFLFIFFSCSKNSGNNPALAEPEFIHTTILVNGINSSTDIYNGINRTPLVKISFNNAVLPSSVAGSISLKESTGITTPYVISYENHDSSIVLRPSSSLRGFTSYSLIISENLRSLSNKALGKSTNITLNIGIDSTDKFPTITDSALLDLVQRQTFKYFWDFGHPVSGLARERNTSGDLVTSGGSGFGVMAIVTGVHRNFITRSQGLARMQTIVGFLKNTAQKFHGAFPHWFNGNTGVVIPFSANDDGADLVETAFLFEGLLTARQYFDGADPAETQLRADINSIYQGVEWDWFRKGTENVLYWHWSPNFAWTKNLPIRGWNESLMVYVLAASSPTHTIPKVVYENGWANNGYMRNGNTFYNNLLPLGPSLGGPLFFEHYSFLGINPFGLNDQYANYQMQAVNHSKINFEYCKANPKGFFGYSNLCWGLTASDIPNGYTASSPNNDVGVIAPTAALSSMPYTPTESMDALRFFYYKLGDKLFKEYGFVDAFKLQDPWFASSFLAIDQGPIISMIENHRSGLLWNLFTSCPEVKAGMIKLGFTAPYL